MESIWIIIILCTVQYVDYFDCTVQYSRNMICLISKTGLTYRECLFLYRGNLLFMSAALVVGWCSRWTVMTICFGKFELLFPNFCRNFFVDHVHCQPVLVPPLHVYEYTTGLEEDCFLSDH